MQSMKVDTQPRPSPSLLTWLTGCRSVSNYRKPWFRFGNRKSETDFNLLTVYNWLLELLGLRLGDVIFRN